MGYSVNHSIRTEDDLMRMLVGICVLSLLLCSLTQSKTYLVETKDKAPAVEEVNGEDYHYWHDNLHVSDICRNINCRDRARWRRRSGGSQESGAAGSDYQDYINFTCCDFGRKR